MRAAVIKFYLANSGFDKEELSEVIGEALFQLELLGYPSITKRVDSLVSGLSRGPKGGKSHDNRCREDIAEEVWKIGSLAASRAADAQRDPEGERQETLQDIIDDHYWSFHDLLVRSRMAGRQDGGQKIQIKTPKQIYQAQGAWVKRKRKEGILK